MKDLYKDKEYIKLSVKVFEDNLEDLEMISANNDDILHMDLTDIKVALHNIKYSIDCLFACDHVCDSDCENTRDCPCLAGHTHI